MRAVESISCDSAAAHHVVASDAVYEFGVSSYYIRDSGFLGVADEIYEGFLETEVSNLVAVMIESEHTVETDGFLRNEEGSQRDVLLHTAAGTDTYDVEHTFLGFLGAGVVIDVSERVNLIHDDVAVIGTDTGRDTGDTFALELTSDGMELTGLNVTLDRSFIKEGGYHVYTILVADEDDLVSQELRFEMQMECRTITIDD